MESFNKLIQNSDLPVLVDFYADWCQPCVLMVPIFRELTDKMKDKVKVVKVDVEKNAMAALKYHVRSIPTLVLFHHGKVLWRNSGVMTIEQIEDNLYKYLLLISPN